MLFGFWLFGLVCCDCSVFWVFSFAYCFDVVVLCVYFGYFLDFVRLVYAFLAVLLLWVLLNC